MLLSRRSLLFAPALLSPGTPSPTSGIWQHCTPMDNARSEMPAVTVNGRIYVAGGFTGGTSAERYDPVADQWQSIAALPYEVNHAGTAVHNDQVVICGGYSADAMTAHDDMLAFDEVANQWQVVGSLPEPIGAFGMTSLDQSLYLAGGATGHLGGEASKLVWRLDLGEEQWTACPPLSIAREHLTLVANQGALFAIGGRETGADEIAVGAVVERWDTNSDAWERLADLPEPRSGLAGASVDSRIIVAGGESSTGAFEAVDLLANQVWSSLPSLPVGVHGLGLATLGSSIFAIGGSTVAGQVASVADVYRLDITPDYF